MHSHWTYRDVEPDEDLCQGDILVPDEGLKKIFKEVHPHFFDSNRYLGFLVITQSCDLVRRGNKKKCSASHISIAVIRSLSAVLDDLVQSVCTPATDQVFFEENKKQARDLLTRILNQNEQKEGIFYLHSDIDSGIGENSVALLRVSVAFRAEHYDTLVESRKGGLNPAFSNKLGWLVGNLYSRVATPDWADSTDGVKNQRDIIDKFLQELCWINKETFELAVKGGVDRGSLNRENIQNNIQKYKPTPIRGALINHVIETVKNIKSVSPDDDLEKLRNRLANSSELAKILKRAKKA